LLSSIETHIIDISHQLAHCLSSMDVIQLDTGGFLL
jgi:hypothetical protein